MLNRIQNDERSATQQKLNGYSAARHHKIVLKIKHNKS